SIFVFCIFCDVCLGHCILDQRKEQTISSGSMSSTIKHFIFDVGNVLVDWEPSRIIQAWLGQSRNELVPIIFESDYWMALNRGEITESDIKSYLTVTLK